ncbi:MAG: hypothetical protein ACKOX6_12385 [Bdellovibrio sp.]
MKNLSVIFLSLAFSSVSFSATNSCETLLKSADGHLETFEEALETNEKLGPVINNVYNDEPVTCADLKSAIKTVKVLIVATSAAAKDMGAAEAMSCEINPETDTEAKEIRPLAIKFKRVLKDLNNAQSTGNCI